MEERSGGDDGKTGLVLGCATGKVDPAEFALGKGCSVRPGIRADFMMFFDATARPARYGKRWSGNELESASFLSAFQTTVMERRSV